MSILQKISDDIKSKYSKDNKLIINDMRVSKVDSISSGCLTVDACSGIGGLTAKGHVVEVFGANTSGKTTLAIQTVVEAQKRGFNSIYIDAESVLDLSYANKLGLKTDDDSFILVQPENGEEVYGIFDSIDSALTKDKSSGGVDLIVVDSVATIRSKEELDGSKKLGTHAALWAKLSIKIKNLAFRHNIAFVLVNQVRCKPSLSGGFSVPGVLSSAQNSDMSDESTTGGEALKFLYSIRWQLKGFSQIKEEDEDIISGEIKETRIGNLINVNTIKNKLALPMVKTQMAVLYGRGTVDLYVLEGIMKKRGFITSQGTYLKYECLDPALQANPDGNSDGKYKGYIYGKAKFNEWFRSDVIQEDVRNRFLKMTTVVVEEEKVKTKNLSFNVE